MSVWLELRCSVSHLPCSEESYDGHERVRCHSHDNATPQIMSAATQKDIISSYKFLSSIAKKEGWIKVDGEWVCSYCAGRLELNDAKN